MKKAIAFLAVLTALSLVLSGCTQPQDPKALYKELTEKSKNWPEAQS